MTIQTRTSLRSRLAGALVAACLSLALGAASGAAQSPSPLACARPDTPVSCGTITPGEPDPNSSGATVAVPQDGLVDVRSQGWDHIDVASDGRTLTIYYWSGVPACYGLAGVDVSQAHGQLDIQLRIGSVPGVEACIEIAQLFQTVVVLDAPLITGGIGG